MSSLYICVISSDLLHASIEENVQYSSIFLSQLTMACLQSAINSRLGTCKPVTVIDGLYNLESDVPMWSDWKFLVYARASTVYLSFVEPADDGVSRAQLSIQHHINME